jgi:uncharacterized protein (DUF1330 family)
MVADMMPFGKFRGRFLVRGGRREVTEGKVRSRTVVLEFPKLRYRARLLPLVRLPRGQEVA